jgi:hypothetical protein
MADKKISALTASTTPLAGTEELPIVQSGATVKVSVANLTAARAVTALSATTTGGLKNISTGSDTESPTQGLFFTDAANKNVIVQLSASGGLSSFVYEAGGAGWRRVAGLLTNGNSVVDVGNLVIGTAGKGIDFSANTGTAGMTSELLNWYEVGTWTGTLTAATSPTTPITKTGRYTRIGNQITVAIEFDNVDTTGASGAMEVTGLPFAAVSAGYGPVMKSGIGTQVIMAGIYGGLSKVIFSDAGTMSTTSIVAGAGVYLRFSATYYV